MKIKEFNNVLKENAQFNIPTKAHEIDVSRFLSTEKLVKTRISFKKLAVSFSSALAVLLIGLFMYLNFTPVATLTIDINPELNLKVNVFNRITSAEALNADAVDLLSNVNLKYKKLDTAVNDIYQYEMSTNRLSSSTMYVLFGVYAKDADDADKLNQALIFDSNIQTVKLFEFEDNLEYFTTVNSNIEGDIGGQYDSEYMPNVADFDSFELTTMTEAEFTQMAADLNITEAKLAMIMAIINSDTNNYKTYTDIETLAGEDLSTLFPIYYASIGQ